MNRIRLVVLLLVLMICGGWFVYKKWPRRPPPDPRVLAEEKARKQQEERTAKLEKHSDAIGDARKRDAEARMKKWQESREAKAQEAFFRKRTLGETRRFPLEETATILSGTLALPAGRSPVLFLAPLYGATGDSTSPTQVLESMIRFHLRPSLPGATPLNLVPGKYIMSPYSRSDDTCKYRDRRPDEYLRDAQMIGADLFTYGRADVVQGNAAIQLAMVDLHTSRSDTFAVNVPVDRIGEAVAQAVGAITKFAGIDDATLVSAGMKPTPDSLPTRAAFEAALADVDTANTTATRNLLASAGPKCPWFHETVVWKVEDDPAVELANETLRRFPKDTRLLALKAHALSVTNDGYAGAVLASEMMRRQPDNLIVFMHLDAMLNETVGSEDYRPLPDPMCHGAYRSAMEHAGRLLERYPRNWPLLWGRCRVSAWAMLTAGTGLVYEALASGQTPKDFAATNYDELTTLCARLGEQSLGDLRRAIDLRPDHPGLMTSLVYWHFQLTDHEGEDSPEKSIVWQYPLLARIHLIDPQNVEADLNVALMQGQTEGNTHVKILTEAVARTNRNPKVMLRIASNLRAALARRMNLDDDDSEEVNKEKAIKHLTGAPEVPLFVEALRIAAKADEPLNNGQVRMAWWLQFTGPPADTLWGDVYNYKNTHWKGANAALKEGNWEECLKHAYRVRWLMSGDEMERVMYCVVKSQWKLGRLRRALSEAEIGISWFPNKHTFHYLFAVVALELNDRLEEAYERAKLAVELDPTNQGCKDTAEKIAKLLGK